MNAVVKQGKSMLENKISFVRGTFFREPFKDNLGEY